MSAFATSMALKCAVELCIADIINSHGGPITLSKIASAKLSAICIIGEPSFDDLFMAFLSKCVKDGGLAFKKVHGCGVWDEASADREFNKLFNDAMSSTVEILMDVFRLEA
ncbi:hypothetical protein FNV43_RR13564 [Rhamnella rubrinervis]|uniref:O-methyltransferase dimerisation domain-containing protein n=1 Tax=Rhamnella rubrinervis TaxID=2594499 RepID=A0A8K0H1D9_9ROSA|nr:hypothetical protein FNV43_RR13564 [Rhamnella rubrinervis]